MHPYMTAVAVVFGFVIAVVGEIRMRNRTKTAAHTNTPNDADKETKTDEPKDNAKGTKTDEPKDNAKGTKTDEPKDNAKGTKTGEPKDNAKGTKTGEPKDNAKGTKIDKSLDPHGKWRILLCIVCDQGLTSPDYTAFPCTHVKHLECYAEKCPCQ